MLRPLIVATAVATAIAVTALSGTVTVAAISGAYGGGNANQAVGRAFEALSLKPGSSRALHDALGAVDRGRVPTLRIDRAVRAA